ncbi:MAG: hypothetical protein J6K98_03780 [Clostridia bacterium]|nr:hypothetical protein [Clostridia bacterium]
MASYVCPKCGSLNVDFQVQQETKTVTKTKSKYKEKGHGILWWLTIGWWWWIIDLCFWVFLFIPRVLLHIGRKRNYKGKEKSVTKDKVQYKTVCLCKDCGHNWVK